MLTLLSRNVGKYKFLTNQDVLTEKGPYKKLLQSKGWNIHY